MFISTTHGQGCSLELLVYHRLSGGSMMLWVTDLRPTSALYVGKLVVVYLCLAVYSAES